MRPDLLHLSPEALTQLTNAGLVKRAVREREAGYAPTLSLEADATLVATFPDGVITRWPAGKPIGQALCSCVATGICRHRLIAALQFRAEANSADVSSATAETANTPENAAAAPTPPPPPVPASPGEASEEALAALLPASILEQAKKERDAGLVVHIRRRADGDPCDTARLPAATVRFWAGAAIEAARCDCIRQSACEHVALGVWAFRHADAETHDSPATGTEVRLGAVASAVRLDPAPYLDYLTALLQHGVVAGATGSAQAASLARAAAMDAGAEWIVHTLADLENWSAAYSERSARYAAETGVGHMAELLLRLKLGAMPGQAKAVLGIGQPHEVALDRLRLFCLGARTERDGEARRTRLVLADQDTGTLMALVHDWQVPAPPANTGAFATTPPPTPQETAKREDQQRTSERLAPGVKLEQLVMGQLLSQQARRFADGRIALARARSAQNSLLPQSGDWEGLTRPLRFMQVADLVRERPRHPLVRTRQAAGPFIVFSPAEITDAFYDPHLQTVQCTALDSDGTPLLLSRSYAAHTRQALETFAAAVSGRHGTLRHVGGLLSWQGDLPTLEPWSFVCDRVMSLDFAGTIPGAAEALASLPLGRASAVEDDPLMAALRELKNLLATLLHHGIRALPLAWPADSRTAVARLRHIGWPALAEALVALTDAVLEQHAPDHAEQLTRTFSALLTLRQLHEDALADAENDGNWHQK